MSIKSKLFSIFSNKSPFVRSLALSVLPVVLVACAFVDRSDMDAQRDVNYADGQHILVTFEQHDFSHVVASPGIDYRQKPFSKYQVPHSVRQQMDSVLEKHKLAFVTAWPMRLIGVLCAVVEVPDDQSVEQILVKLRSDKRVESAQAMQWLSVNSPETLNIGEQAQPGVGIDPYARLQKSLAETGVFSAHQKVTGKGVRVAIVDTNIDSSHVDLSGKVVREKNFTPFSGVGIHGTAVAGIIAATEGNGMGMVGVAPDVELMSYSGCWPAEGEKRAICNSFTLAQAISAAIEANVDIVNLSLSGPRDPLLERLVRVALEKRITVVAAIDVDRPRQQQFPAALNDVLIAYVHSDSGADDESPFYAPGIDILATVPNDAYDFKSGSSMAAAHLSGIVALLKQYRGNIDQRQIMSLLQGSVGIAEPGGATNRLINACRALRALGESIDCRI